MKRSIVWFTILMTLLATGLSAQDTGNNGESAVKGVVENADGNPIGTATVALFVANSPEPETGVATGVDGEFELPVPPGEYRLVISFLSYEDHQQEITLREGETLDVGTITLIESTADLDEVVVEARTPGMEMRFDRRIFRADDDIESFGGDALDLVDNIPSIETDFDGNISLRGSDNVRVLINGRSSALLSGGTQALAAIPAESIERIEVITNPSARYQAEGDAGVINIVLKRNRIAGFNGSVMARAGTPSDYRSSANINFLSNNINWFTNVGFRYRDRPSESSRFQRSEVADPPYAYSQDQERNRKELRGNIRVGAEIFIGETQTLIPSAYMRLRDRTNTSETLYRDMDLDGNMIREVFRDGEADEDRSNFEFEVAYEKRFSNENRLLTADAKFDYQPEWEANSLLETNLTTGEVLGRQRTDNREEEYDMQYRVDYVHPVGDAIELEFGARSSFEWTESSFLVEDFVDDEWQQLDDFSFDFDFYENVNAIYAIGSTQVGKFSVQGGLRGEQTILETKVGESNESSRRNFTNLFPSVFMGYEINDNNSIQASYSRRLSRPRSRNITPFSNYRDSRNIFRGNPDLNPVFSNSYEISYLRYWNTGSANASIYNRYRTGVVERITLDQSDGVTERFPINLSTQNRWGAELAVSQDLGDDIRVRTSINYFISNTDGEYLGQQFQSEASAVYGRVRFQWRVTETFRLQTTYRYSGPRSTTQGSRGSSQRVNAGLTKDLFDGKATLSFSGRDLFNTRGRTTIVDQPGFYSESENRWRTRSMRLNFMYRFSPGN